MKRRLLWGGLDPTCFTWADTYGAGELFRLLPRITFVSALLPSGGTNNHAVADRRHADRKTDKDQFASPR